MKSNNKRKLFVGVQDEEHFWSDSGNFPDVPNKEWAIDIARNIRKILGGQPVIMEEGKLAIDPKKIQCEDCRSRLERGG
ncbi:MAG: hypothetical protein ACC618_03950 [Patescibacteria group bacterium]